MLPVTAVHYIILLLPLVSADDANAPPWSYENKGEWGEDYPKCNGRRQSPIDLSSRSSTIQFIPPLKFTNYDVDLMTPLTLRNDGHSVNLGLPPTTNNNTRASISGGRLRSRYEAVGLHFHWGSSNSKGSEHTINGRRYDVEMHIVHKNVDYATVEDANENADGLSVLGIFLKIVDGSGVEFTGLKKIFDRLMDLITYDSTATINGSLKLGHVLGNLNTKDFYTYSGSLTTPPCAQSVIWNVFPQPVAVERSDIEKFFQLRDRYGQPLINNYRDIQPRNGRQVTHRIGGGINPIFLPFPKI